MLFIWIIFLPVFLIAFGAVIFLLRPTQEESSVERRVAAVLNHQAGEIDARLSAPTLLVARRGAFPWVDRLLIGTKLYHSAIKLLVQSATEMAAGTLFVLCGCLSACVFAVVYFVTSSVVAAVAAGFVALYLPVGILQFKRTRRVRAFNDALPECIEMCSRSLRAGHSIVAALDIIANEAREPAKGEFREVFNKQNYGLPLRDALLQMLERTPSIDLQVMVTAILVQKDTGGNLAEIMDRTLFVIRERLRIQGEIRVNTAQGRLTGWILTLLPVFLMLVINVMNPGYSTILFHDPTGQKMLYAGAGLLVLGGIVINHIVNGIEV